jgi:hypothetical protein
MRCKLAAIREASRGLSNDKGDGYGAVVGNEIGDGVGEGSSLYDRYLQYPPYCSTPEEMA